MRVLPWRLGGVAVILDVFDVLAALEHQYTQSAFGELLRGPPAGNTRADDDRVKGFGLSLHHHLVPPQFTTTNGLKSASARATEQRGPRGGAVSQVNYEKITRT